MEEKTEEDDTNLDIDDQPPVLFENGIGKQTPDVSIKMTNLEVNNKPAEPSKCEDNNHTFVTLVTGGVEEMEDENKDILDRIGNFIRNKCNIYKRGIERASTIIIFVLHNVFLGFAIHNTWDKFDSWCDGTKFLVLLTIMVYMVIIYSYLIEKYVFKILARRMHLLEPVVKLYNYRYTSRFLWSIIGISIAVFLIVDTWKNPIRLISAVGLLVLILLGYLFSAHRKHVIWKQVMLGSLVQFIFGVIILRWNVGRQIFQCFGDKIHDFLLYTDEGSGFVFGYLVTGKLSGELPEQMPIFGFKVLSVIIFFSFFTSILFYYGIMQLVIMKIGWFLQNTIGTTACESMNAAGNIFIGQTEAPLLIKPYIHLMTKSEIHAVMTGGFATIAGGVLAAFINFGVSASHLLTASVMSAPAALAYSKLFYPETEESKTQVKDIKLEKGKETNVLEAAINGLSASISLVANIAVNLISIIAAIHFLDNLLNWFGGLIGWEFLTFEWLLSKFFVPLAYLMGVEWNDCEEVARLVGLKTVLNEFVAYLQLMDLMKQKKLSPRSEAIATYALCGFSNFSSIGIQLGALSAMAPERKADISRVAVRAMIAGSAACFMTACIAGTLIQEPTN